MILDFFQFNQPHDGLNPALISNDTAGDFVFLMYSCITYWIRLGNYSPQPASQARAAWRRNPRSPVRSDVLPVFPSPSTTRMRPARGTLPDFKRLITQQAPVIGRMSNNFDRSRANNAVNPYTFFKGPPIETTIPNRIVWCMCFDATHSHYFEHAGCQRQNSGASRVQPDQWMRAKTAGGYHGATVARGTPR